jgi:hypothetical protein
MSCNPPTQPVDTTQRITTVPNDNDRGWFSQLGHTNNPPALGMAFEPALVRKPFIIVIVFRIIPPSAFEDHYSLTRAQVRTIIAPHSSINKSRGM